MNSKQSGVTLAEVVVTLGMICLVSVMLMPPLLTSYQERDLTSKRQSALADLGSILTLGATSVGEFPMNFGPARIVDRFSRLDELQNFSDPSVGVCPVDAGEKVYKLPNGSYLTSVSTTWKSNVNNTGQNGDMVCLALRGAASSEFGKDAFWVFLPREGAPQLSNLLPSQYKEVAWWSSWGGTVQSGINLHKAFGGTSLTEMDWLESILKNFLGNSSDAETAMFNTNLGGFTVGIFDTSGSVLKTISIADFIPHITIDGVPYNEAAGPILTEYAQAVWGPLNDPDFDPFNVPNCAGDNRYACDGHASYLSSILMGHWRQTSLTSEQVALGENYLETMKARTVVYTDPATQEKYRLNVGYFSPVKLSLNGVSAKLNSDDFFPFDVDGKSGKMAPFVTTGGVNKNEAWLATDRNGDGFWVKGVQDGRDVFGDHLGRYKSGYDDLAALYKHALKKDANGKRYIALKKLSFLEKQQANVARLTSKPKQFDPSIDLKLLTRDRKVFFASDFVDKIYVDYQDVNELDAKKQNWIRQRAQVHYLGGQTVTSADQWFQAGFIFTPLSDAEVKKLKSKAAQVKSTK